MLEWEDDTNVFEVFAIVAEIIDIFSFYLDSKKQLMLMLLWQ
jgi:hypothetical protein